MELWILELVKNNGIAGGLVIALFLFLKYNGFNKISKEHEEQKNLLIKNLEKFNDIKEILIRIEEHIRNKLNNR